MLQTVGPFLTLTPVASQPIPVDIASVKALLSIDFTQHDARLSECVKAAMGQVEKRTGLLLRPYEVQVRFSELYDWESLPGPVTGTITEADDKSFQTVGDSFVQVMGDYPGGLSLSYTGGYTRETLPFALREAWIQLAADLFEGTDTRRASSTALLAEYSRLSWIL